MASAGARMGSGSENDRLGACGPRITRSAAKSAAPSSPMLNDKSATGACPLMTGSAPEKLANAGRATLAAMRESVNNPARSPEATAKKREKSRSTSLAMRAWEREHGRGDPETYDRDVLPKIQKMTVPRLMELTGLSQFHCWKVRKGERRLHARHWRAIE